MFQKFTKNAVEAVSCAQDIAKAMNHKKVYPEHFLLGLFQQKSGLVTKIFKHFDLQFENVKMEIDKILTDKRGCYSAQKVLPFSESARDILSNTLTLNDNLNTSCVTCEHILLSMLENENLSNLRSLFKKFNFDIERIKVLIVKSIGRSERHLNPHPENEYNDFLNRDKSSSEILEESKVMPIFKTAVSKLSTLGYEILGTEQIILSLLEQCDVSLSNILCKHGIDAQIFAHKLEDWTSRNDEFEEKQVVFTPNASKLILNAIDYSKQFADSSIKPEHLILGLLKSKCGIAYKILESCGLNINKLEKQILQSCERSSEESLTILKFARDEASIIGTNIVGSEMLLMGILAQGICLGACVLLNLGVNIKDCRNEIKRLLKKTKFNNEKDIVFSERAQSILDLARKNAKQKNIEKIKSEDILLAMTQHKDCLAMKVLENLGTDILEIRQGIFNKQMNVV